MADTTETTTNTSEGEGKNTDVVQGAVTQPATTEVTPKSEGTFTQADIDRILRERLAEEKTRREKEANDKKLQEDGKFQELLSARDKDLEATQAQLKAARVEAAFTWEAAKLGIAKLDAAYKLIKDDVEMDADGKPTNLEKLLKAAIADVPGLAGDGQVQQGAGGGINSSRQTGNLTIDQQIAALDTGRPTRNTIRS